MSNNEASATRSSTDSARNKRRVAIVGATGMVGQQLIRMLKSHPWLTVVKLAASSSSAGKPYAEAVGARWCMDFDIPADLAAIKVIDAENVSEVVADVDIVFSAVAATKEEILKLEDAYAKAGAWVTSCNSAYRGNALVPMMIPAANPQHLQVIEKQRKERGYTTGAIIVKSNCSIQSYVIALQPLRKFGIEKIRVHSEQAISGAGKTFATWPDMLNNLIPLISGEEQKSEQEPLKVWGELTADGIKNATTPRIKAKCVRVAVQDGHTAYVEVQFKEQPTAADIEKCWKEFKACEGLPSAPAQFVHFRSEADRPQPRLDVMTENGMAVTVGQLKIDEDGVSFTALAHNAILGAAGGAVLATELAIQQNLVYQRSLALA